MDKKRTVMPLIAGILAIVSAGFKLFMLVGILGLLSCVPVYHLCLSTSPGGIRWLDGG